LFVADKPTAQDKEERGSTSGYAILPAWGALIAGIKYSVIREHRGLGLGWMINVLKKKFG
jgi:hypothetical protein